MIPVVIKKLKRKEDDRGWLAEILRPEHLGASKFGQLIVTTAHPGKTKGNHFHKRKREWYCVIRGKGRLVITDLKSGEKRALDMDDENLLLVEIPRGYLHTITNTGEKMMYLLAYLNEPFDKKDPDTYYVNDTGK